MTEERDPLEAFRTRHRTRFHPLPVPNTCAECAAIAAWEKERADNQARLAEARVEEGDRRSVDSGRPLQSGATAEAASPTEPMLKDVPPSPTSVEDSHAKLAAEMRHETQLTGNLRTWSIVPSWAARVEQLGRVEEKKAAVIKYAKALQAQIGDGKPQWASALSNTLTLDLFDAVRALVESEKERASKKEERGT